MCEWLVVTAVSGSYVQTFLGADGTKCNQLGGGEKMRIGMPCFLNSWLTLMAQISLKCSCMS